MQEACKSHAGQGLVTESIFMRQSLQAYSPQSAAGRDYRAFVAEYLEEVR